MPKRPSGPMLGEARTPIWTKVFSVILLVILIGWVASTLAERVWGYVRAIVEFVS